MRKAIFMIALTGSIVAASVQASYAQSGGGGGGGAGGGGAAGGSSAGSSTANGASSGSAAGSPSAGSSAGSLGVSRPPQSPANAAGLDNSGNDLSGAGNGRNSNQGMTTGLANPSANSREQNPPNGDRLANPPQGTNSAGTANSSGVGGGVAHGPTTTRERASDAEIDAENRKADRKVKSICKGC